MNKTATSIIVIVIVIVVGVIGYFAYKSSYKTSSSNSTNSISLNTTTQSQPNSVSLENMSFQPGTLSISVGDEVTWTNNDSVTHTVAADDSSFQSNQLDNGGSFKHVFNKSGTYKYHCSIHPSMTGEIIVK